MDHNIYKIIETHRKEFGAQSGREVLGEEYSLDNLQRVVMKPSRGWIKNQPVPKRTQAVEAWCRLAWQQAPQLWNNRKFHMSQTKHEFQIYWTVHFEERISKNLETLLFYTKKTLACCYWKQLPAREGDTRGARPLRLEAVKLRPQVTSYSNSNSGCSVPQVRVWLCRVLRKGNTS